MYKAFNAPNSSDLTKSVQRSTPLQTFKLSSASFYDNQSLTLAYYVSKVNKSLGFLTSHYTINPVSHKDSNPSFNKIYSLMPDVVSNSFKSDVRFQIKEVSNQVGLYTLTSSLQEN
jgi:hypothetical protein